MQALKISFLTLLQTLCFAVAFKVHDATYSRNKPPLLWYFHSPSPNIQCQISSRCFKASVVNTHPTWNGFLIKTASNILKAQYENLCSKKALESPQPHSWMRGYEHFSGVCVGTLTRCWHSPRTVGRPHEVHPNYFPISVHIPRQDCADQSQLLVYLLDTGNFNCQQIF